MRLRQALNPTHRLPRLLPRNSNSSNTIRHPREVAPLGDNTNTHCRLRIIRNTTSHHLAARPYKISLLNNHNSLRHNMARLATAHTQVLATQGLRVIRVWPSNKPVSSKYHKHHNSRNLEM